MGEVARKRHSANFKARVALEAIRGEDPPAGTGARTEFAKLLPDAKMRWKRRPGRCSMRASG